MNSCKLLQRYLPVQKTLNTFSEELQEYLKELQTFKGDFEGESVSVFKKSVPKYENEEAKPGNCLIVDHVASYKASTSFLFRAFKKTWKNKFPEKNPASITVLQIFCANFF